MLSPEIIEVAVRNFRQAIQTMSSTGRAAHAFDLGDDANGKRWSLFLLIGPEESIDRLLNASPRTTDIP